MKLAARKGSALLIIVLVGCATTPPPAAISPELRRAAGAVHLLDGPVPAGFRIAGSIQGFACGANERIIPQLSLAREQLKVEAARLKATAVAAILCQEERWPYHEGCYRVIRCMGDAGHLPEAGAAPSVGAPSP